MMNSDNSLREIITDVENITLNGEFKPFGQQPDTETPDNPQNVSEVLIDDFIFQGELQRLKEIYRISLNKEQMAKELHIRATSMDTRIRDKIDLPSFQRSQGGKIIFPITAVAKFLASNLVDSE